IRNCVRFYAHLNHFKEECKRKNVEEIESDETVSSTIYLFRELMRYLKREAGPPTLGIAFDEANYIHLKFPEGFLSLRQEDCSMLVGIKSALSRVIRDYKYIAIAGISLSLLFRAFWYTLIIISKPIRLNLLRTRLTCISISKKT
ncbi:hypothetical protein AKO1_010903, partial [Acrasis kona]